MPLKEFKADLIPKLKELNLYVKKNLLSTALSGELASTLKGRGVEFEDYRDYDMNDDAQRIDWRASKRSQRLLVREYKIEVSFHVFFLIDVSETMLFASTSKLKCEYAAEAVTSLFFGIGQTGAAVGFGLFNDRLTKVVKPMMGKKQFYIFTKEIANPKNYGGPKNIARAMQQTLSILDKKTLIILVSDFLTEDEKWIEFLKILANKHEIMGVMVRDPLDIELPESSGQLVVGNPYGKERLYIDSKQYSTLYKDFNIKQQEILRTIFQRHKSSVLELNTSEPFLDPMLKYFRRKGGRWR